MKSDRSKKPSTRYKQLRNGDSFELKLPEVINLACCDCGLVHRIAFAIEDNGRLGIAMKRAARATSELRKRPKYQKRLRQIAPK